MVGIGVASNLLSAYGASEKGKADANALDQQAAFEKMSSADVLQRGAAGAGRVREQASQVIGQNRSALSSSGVDAQQGSAAQAAEDVRTQSELDVGTVRANAAREAWGHDVRSQQLSTQAQNVRDQTELSVLSTFLGGAASTAASGMSTYRAFKK
jgi:hypothetical protein